MKRQIFLIFSILTFLFVSCKTGTEPANNSYNNSYESPQQPQKSTEHSFSEYDKSFTLTIKKGIYPKNYTVNYKYYRCKFCGLDYDNRSSINYTGYYMSSGYNRAQASMQSSNYQSTFYNTSYSVKVSGTKCIEH